ncbi:MAG: hypothetical protein V4454_02625 [Pseudomonadota bacterium]
MAMVISSSHLARGNRVTTLSMVLAPLHALIGLFMPLQSASAMLRHPPKQEAAQEAARTRAFNAARMRLANSSNASVTLATPARPTSCSRLKIVRAFEPGVSPACAGRMVITGRMADVCAELDRMAQREAAPHTLF